MFFTLALCEFGRDYILKKGLNRLTLLMYSHHNGPVLRVDAEQDRCPDQVLREVTQQWHCPANTSHFHTELSFYTHLNIQRSEIAKHVIAVYF